MEWKRGSFQKDGTGSSLIAPTCAMPMLPMGSFIDERECRLRGCLSASNAVTEPACLSFVSLPISEPSLASQAECFGSILHYSVTSPFFASAAHEGAVREACYSPCSCSMSPPMHSLLPSPFSCSSFAAFFPAHVAVSQCPASAQAISSTCVSSAAAPCLSSIPRRRQRKLDLKVGTWETRLKLSSVASIASSLPSFAAAETVFGADAKDDLKGNEGMTKNGISDTQSLLANLAAGNARFRKDAASFFQQLSSDVQGLQRQFLAKKSNESNSFLVDPDPNEEAKAQKSKEGTKKAIQTTQHLMAGAVAAMVSRTVVAPLERLKLEYLVRGAKGSVMGTLQTILLNEGVRGFWKGNGVNVLRTAPFKAVNFFAYDVYRKHLLKWGDRAEVTNAERLAAGAAAGITATILCFPLDTIRTIMVAPGGEALGGMIGCFQTLLRTEGFPALYKGLLPAVVSMAPAGAVFYGVYDMLKSAYLSSPEGREMRKKRRKQTEERPEELSTQLELGPFRTLLYGAIAGACSETVTYPLEVVRRAQQMQHAANKLSMTATIQSLMTKGGVKALYAGLLPSTLQVLPSAALSYFVYETVKVAFKIP